MEWTGKFKGIQTDYMTCETVIMFTMNEKAALSEVDKIKDIEKLRIEAVQYRKKRSLDANGMFWSCVGEIAKALRCDKWEVYLQMLKRYGQYTYICVKPHMVDAMKAQWRECEVVGEVDINGQKAIQMLVYFGSSTYNTQEFSVLLDGVISEMKEIGLQPPASREMQEALKQWEKMHNEKCNP